MTPQNRYAIVETMGCTGICRLVWVFIFAFFYLW